MWGACGVAAGGGDVGAVVLAEHADRDVAEACHHAGQAAGVGGGGVLGEGCVADVVELVLDLPMPRIQSAICSPVAAPGGRLVTKWSRSIVIFLLVR